MLRSAALREVGDQMYFQIAEDYLYQAFTSIPTERAFTNSCW